MKKLLLTLLVAFASSATFAQDFIGIKGELMDSTGTPLPYATVAALSPADSTMVGFGISGDDGKFLVELDDTGTYLVKIVLVGYGRFNAKVTLTPENPIKDYGVIPMDADMLATLDITAEHIPVLIKGDTVEYNADAFKTDPNAPVEDLLRKLPGVEVDQDGNVKAQGEDVTKVFVDGKEFFGDDPKVATRNLPADAVQKVQVYDKQSETAEFTGVDDGERSKTINIELKEDKKNGAFGKLTGGAGWAPVAEDLRFKMKGNLNKFNKKLQISLIGMGNNTSEDGFSWEDYVSFMGGMKNMGDGGWRGAQSSGMNINGGGASTNGLVTTASGGMNLNYEFSKKTKLNVSYFLYRANRDLEELVIRNNWLDTTSYNTSDSSSENTVQWTHRVNLRFEHQIDTLREIEWSATGNYATNDFAGIYSNITTSDIGEMLNMGERNSGYSGADYSGSSRFIFRNKFKKKEGRNFVVELNGSYANSDYLGDLYNLSTFNTDTVPTYDTLNQNQSDFSTEYSWSAQATYTEPIGEKNKFLSITGTHGQNIDDTEYDVFDILSESPYMQNYNPFLSSNFKRGFEYTTASTAFRWILNDKWNMNPGLKVKWIGLDGTDRINDTTIVRDYFNFLPFVSIRFTPKQTSNWRLNYRTEINAPSIDQLQNRVDNSDPFNVVTGNPELLPEYSHNLSLHGGKFSQFSMAGFYGGFQGTYTRDKIQYASTINQNFTQVSAPINVDYDWSSFAYTGFYAPFKLTKKLKMKTNLNFSGRYSKGLFEINGTENSSDGYRGTVSVGLENQKKEKLDVSFGGTWETDITAYSEQSGYRDQQYTSLSGYVDIRWNINPKWVFRTSYDHTQYTSAALEDITVVPLLRASVSRYVMKNNRGELKVEAFDIFDQNRGISRTITRNYFQERRTNSIGRYYMVSFTYSLSKMGQDSQVTFRHGRRRG